MAISERECWPPTIEYRRGPASVKAHLSALLDQAITPPSVPAYRRGRGIVYVGGGKYWPGIRIGIQMLRMSGCTLPVEVWHRGALEPIPTAELAGLDDVWPIDATKIAECGGDQRVEFQSAERGGWEAKLYALTHTTFREVLYLDADAYCVADPAPLLDNLTVSPFVFWSDLPRMNGCVTWERVYPVGARGVPTVQGGQFAIDTVRAWPTLSLAHWICQHSDYYFAHMYGDQDAWRVALAVKGAPYLCLGQAEWTRPAFVCRVIEGRHAASVPLIVHRCQSKLFTDEQPDRNDALPYEDRVFRLFDEYRSAYCPPAPLSE